jgi:hypothetical protein
VATSSSKRKAIQLCKKNICIHKQKEKKEKERPKKKYKKSNTFIICSPVARKLFMNTLAHTLTKGPCFSSLSNFFFSLFFFFF